MSATDSRMLDVVIHHTPDLPPLAFAAAEIERAVARRGGAATCLASLPSQPTHHALTVILVASPDESERLAAQFQLNPPRLTDPQSYAIRTATGDAPVVAAFGADPTGAMYGGLDIAEAIALDTLDALADRDHSPHILRRGIKFNIPLDARTPSYSDASDSAQHNIPEVWQKDFWRDYLDEMARHRFNVMTLWNLHPFPSMVKVPGFEDVALDDVMRTRAPFDDTFSLCGHDMVRPETLADLECVVRMTIDQKIAFWQWVMRYAHGRGIETYIFTWNIFTFGADGKYGITHDQDNPATIRYFRASIRQMVLTYPHLAGFGITAGERMQSRDDQFDKEPWLFEAYGRGVVDALQEQPDREVRMIHRYHQSALSPILDAWREYPCTFDLSYKYAIAHMYAHPAPPFAREVIAELPRDLRMWMTVRNDDIYSFRWADPTFARDFIHALPDSSKLAGFYMGPDGYTWGRECIDTEPHTPRQLVIQKQWLSFMLWGRLSYDPTLPDAWFERVLASRFTNVDAPALFQALRQASRIIPLVNRFHWERLDFQWFPEACLSRHSYKGFHTIRHFVDGPTMPESGLLSPRDFAEAQPAERTIRAVTPPQVVDQLRDLADSSARLAASINGDHDKELRHTLGDIHALAHLGRYYAAKIEAATSLARLDQTADPVHRDAAVTSLRHALHHWRAYADAAAAQYQPQLLTRIGHVDLHALTDQVDHDIALAQHWRTQAPTR